MGEEDEWNAELATLLGVLSARWPAADPRSVRQLATGVLLLSALPEGPLLADGVAFLHEDLRRRGLQIPEDRPESDPDEVPAPVLMDGPACIANPDGASWCGRDRPLQFPSVADAVAAKQIVGASVCPGCIAALATELAR